MSTETAFTSDDRNAMRAFIQRSEVRLSTMHRIVTAFISGAGLLTLIPIFFKDVVASFITILILTISNFYPELGNLGMLLSVLLYVAIGFPILLSLAIPLYALYLLLKDIVHFYFTVYMPGYPQEILNPSLSTSPVLFSQDESNRVKEAVMRFQYTSSYMNYMMPFSHERRVEYFDSMIRLSKGDIIPKTRSLEKLREMGVVSDDADESDVQHFNAALGIVRAFDRQLVEEVAQIEMTMIRCAMYIRRMLLRYVKALLMFIWTMLTLFILLPIIESHKTPILMVLAGGYIIWSLTVIWVLHLPITWIYRHRHEELNMTHLDPQLTLLENNMRKYCYAALLSSILGLFLTIPIYL